MFRNIYRAMVISRTKSKATKVANSLSKHMLKDIGQADLKKAQAAFFGKPTRTLFPDFITNTSLSPVVILSSKGSRLGQRLLRGRND